MAWQTVGLRTHVWNNNIRAGLLLAGFPLLLALLALGLALLTTGSGLGFEQDLRAALALMPALLPACFAVAAAWFAIAFLAHRPILNGITGARFVTREAEMRLWNITENLCISRGLPMPRLAVIETAERNAYASGLRATDGQVTVTRGLMDALDDRELAAVVAHELTHLRNGDARLALIAAVFAGILSLVAEVIVRGRMRVRIGGGGDRRGAGIAALVGLVIILAAAALATALRFALSRNREFLADAGAVELTQDADAMASALRRIEGRSAMPRLPSQVQAMLLDWPSGARGFSLWATHPSLEARIEALTRVAGARDPGPLPDPPPPAKTAPEGEPGVPWWQAGATPLEGPTPKNPWGPRRDTPPPPSPWGG